MKYSLNKNIHTFEQAPIRSIDNQTAQVAAGSATRALKQVLEDSDLAGDAQDIIGPFQNKLADAMLSETITFRQAIRLSLMHYGQGQTATEKEQLARYDLLMKLVADVVELESDEIAMIRKAVADRYNHPIIVGRVRDLLEGKEASEKAGKNKNKTKKSTKD